MKALLIVLLLLQLGPLPDPWRDADWPLRPIDPEQRSEFMGRDPFGRPNPYLPSDDRGTLSNPLICRDFAGTIRCAFDR